MFISCSNIPHWMLYPYVSSKYFILKIKSMFGGFEFFRLKVPQSPLSQGLQIKITLVMSVEDVM